MLNLLTNIAASGNTPGFIFDPMQFVKNLQYMGVGMLVIFVVIGIIALTTVFINWLFSEK